MFNLKIYKKINLAVFLISSTLTIDKIKNFLDNFRNDNRGALLIPIELKLKDIDFLKYCHLEVDWDIPPLTKDDLPHDFSNKALKLINLFRRKTINLNYECFLYFDYVTGEIIYCFVKDDGENVIEDYVDERQFKGMNIASIHNHPKECLSAPSGENFQILDLEFEDYELISGYDEFWIIEAKGIIDNSYEIKKRVLDFYNFYLGDFIQDIEYGNYLINYLNDGKNNINITKKDFD